MDVSTQRIQSVIKNQIVKTEILTVLVNTHINSSLFDHSQSADFSKYLINLDVNIFDNIKVQIITITAKTRFISKSLEKKLNIIQTFSFDVSTSLLETTADTLEVKKENCNKINNIRIFNFFIIKKI
jgi:hypothetical protein